MQASKTIGIGTDCSNEGKTMNLGHTLEQIAKQNSKPWTLDLLIKAQFYMSLAML